MKDVFCYLLFGMLFFLGVFVFRTPRFVLSALSLILSIHCCSFYTMYFQNLIRYGYSREGLSVGDTDRRFNNLLSHLNDLTPSSLSNLHDMSPEARFSKVSKTFRAGKAICEIANRLFWKADLLTCFQGN